MEGESIKKISGIAESWWKILTIFAAVIFGIYQLSIVWITISETKKEVEELKQSIINDNSVRDDRSNKRYDRASEMYNELKENEVELKADFQKHLIEDAYHRGYVDAQLKK